MYQFPFNYFDIVSLNETLSLIICEVKEGSVTIFCDDLAYKVLKLECIWDRTHNDIFYTGEFEREKNEI